MQVKIFQETEDFFTTFCFVLHCIVLIDYLLISRICLGFDSILLSRCI